MDPQEPRALRAPHTPVAGLPTRREWLAGAVGALLASTLAHAQTVDEAGRRGAVLDLLRTLIGDADRPLTGISVAWLKGDDQISRVWAGWRTIGSEHPSGSQTIDGNTLYRVASISKAALAVAMLRLHDARVLDLDADLAPLLRHPLRHPRFPNQPITPRLLLSHRSGLLDVATLPQADGEVFRRTLSSPSSWGTEEPGRMFRYGSFGHVVLATAMETAARQPFDALMQRWLFEPLGMTARYHPSALVPAQREQLSALYRRADRAAAWTAQIDSRQDAPHPAVTPQALAAIGENASVHSPHGGLRASVPDLSRLTKLLMQQGRWEGRRLLSADAYQQLLRPHWTAAADAPGDTAGGLFRSWTAGLQRFTDTHDGRGGDRLHARGGWPAYGHFGAAYGLLGGLLFHPPQGNQPAWGLVYVINGTSQGAMESPGMHSSLRRSEERLIESLLDHIGRTRDAA